MASGNEDSYCRETFKQLTYLYADEQKIFHIKLELGFLSARCQYDHTNAENVNKRTI